MVSMEVKSIPFSVLSTVKYALFVSDAVVQRKSTFWLRHSASKERSSIGRGLCVFPPMAKSEKEV